jgi:hypothetical protein
VLETAMRRRGFSRFAHALNPLKGGEKPMKTPFYTSEKSSIKTAERADFDEIAQRAAKRQEAEEKQIILFTCQSRENAAS